MNGEIWDTKITGRAWCTGCGWETLSGDIQGHALAHVRDSEHAVQFLLTWHVAIKRAEPQRPSEAQAALAAMKQDVSDWERRSR